MTANLKDLGALQVLIHRFNTQRLRRLLRIKRALDQGRALEASEVEFLHLMLRNSAQMKPLFDRHPPFQELFARMVTLLHEITQQALANEMNADRAAERRPGAPRRPLRPRPGQRP